MSLAGRRARPAVPAGSWRRPSRRSQLDHARKLLAEAEQECKKGNLGDSASKARSRA